MALINCPECGKSFSDKAKMCPHCGVNIEELTFCENCKHLINPTDVKCPNCNTATPWARKCPECGEGVSVTDETCPNCGFNLFHHFGKVNVTRSCPKCGCPMQGNEQTCPECGYLISKEETESHYYDDIDYSNYFNGGLKTTFFEAEYEDEKDSYDSWNDFNLFWIFLLRIILLTLVPFFIYGILLILLALNNPDTNTFILLAFIGLIPLAILTIVFFRMAMRKYWVPLHRTWRRINKRFWINMYKGVKHNNVDIL